MVQHNQGMVPGETWRKKHAHPKRFVLSGPPRDLVGLRDRVPNRYQQAQIDALRERDRQKYLACEKEPPAPEPMFPPVPARPIPNNQRAVWYEIKALERTKAHLYGEAYWYLVEAAKKAKTLKHRRQIEQTRDANLRTWRQQYGYA